MDRLVPQVMHANLGIACQDSAESAQQLTASQVVPEVNFARGFTMVKLTCAVHRRAMETLVLPRMLAHLGIECQDSAESVRLLIAAQVAHHLNFA